MAFECLPEQGRDLQAEEQPKERHRGVGCPMMTTWCGFESTNWAQWGHQLKMHELCSYMFKRQKGRRSSGPAVALHVSLLKIAPLPNSPRLLMKLETWMCKLGANPKALKIPKSSDFERGLPELGLDQR